MADGYGKAPRQRHTGSRPQPYDPSKDRTHSNNAGAMETDEEGMFETPANAYKVGTTTDPRALSTTITQACQFNSEMPALLTIGNGSINQAVKGIAIAAAELKGAVGDLTFQPAFRHVNRTKPLIAFYLTRQRFGDRLDAQGEVAELTASANQKIVALAGAIAGKVREHKRTHVVALGADAVTNAVLAIGNARLFLEDNSMDIKVLPEFTKIMKNGQQMSAIKFNVIPERIA